MLNIMMLRSGNSDDYTLKRDGSKEAFRVGDGTSALMPATGKGTCKVTAPTSRYWVATEETTLETADGNMVQVVYKGDYIVELEGRTIVLMKKDEFERVMTVLT